MRVWKLQLANHFSVSGITPVDVEVPQGACALHAGEQDDCWVCIWVSFDGPPRPPEARRFYLLATGQPLTARSHMYLTHIDTVLMKNGDVWHVFEEARTASI